MPKRNGKPCSRLRQETPVPMKGAQMVWEALVREGVRVVYGHPGGAILPTYDALSPYEAEGKIHHVLVRHEQCAAHMADGWARATGEVGVCIVTSGPAATNLVTGLATAQMDSVPIVAITGQVPTNLLGTDAFQEADVVGVTAPVCKHNYLVTDVNDLPLILKEAFYIAREGRPGVVLIDICKDVQNATGMFRYDFEIDLPGFEPWPNVDMEVVRKAAELINKAERPLVLSGHGVTLAGMGRELLEMVERAEIPVVTTLLGAGNIPESHPLSLGMGGMHGEAYANRAVQGCDVLIAMGMRFDDRITGVLSSFAKQAKIIHFELDKAEVGKNVVPDVPVIGDLAETLPALLPLIEERRHQVWLQEIKEWKSDTDQSDIINYEVDELIPPFVIRQLWHATHTARKRPADHRDRRRPASDVGEPVLHPRPGRAIAHQRRPGDDGLCTAGGDWRADGLPGSAGLGRGGRRRLPDDAPGAGRHQAGARSADQDRDHQQRLPGHGAPVAAALLRTALHRHADLGARFRQAGGGLRHSWPARHAPG